MKAYGDKVIGHEVLVSGMGKGLDIFDRVKMLLNAV